MNINVNRFWSKVDKPSSDDCWRWAGYFDRCGYGLFYDLGKLMKAHRVSHYIAHGDIPAGMNVRHSCGSPACVNPSHLYLEKNKTDDIEEAFWVKVDKRSDDECWEWKASRNKRGYGQFGIRCGHEQFGLPPNASKRPIPAHRVSYVIHNGPIPPGMCICHTCDNPPCVNPNHLFLGTKADNSKDASQKGRMKGWRLHGEDHQKSKLTNTMVLAIVNAEGKEADIAERFGVTQTCVSAIKHGITWTRVTGIEKAPSRRKRSIITDDMRADILSAKGTHREIADRFGVGKSAVGDIMKNCQVRP